MKRYNDIYKLSRTKLGDTIWHATTSTLLKTQTSLNVWLSCSAKEHILEKRNPYNTLYRLRALNVKKTRSGGLIGRDLTRGGWLILEIPRHKNHKNKFCLIKSYHKHVTSDIADGFCQVYFLLKERIRSKNLTNCRKRNILILNRIYF